MRPVIAVLLALVGTCLTIPSRIHHAEEINPPITTALVSPHTSIDNKQGSVVHVVHAQAITDDDDDEQDLQTSSTLPSRLDFGPRKRSHPWDPPLHAPPLCSDFVIDSATDSVTNSVRVTEIKDCTESSSEEDCALTVADLQLTFHSSWIINSIIRLGVFNYQSTFGKQYAKTLRFHETGVTYQLLLGPGESGFVAADAAVTEFKGHFRDCKNLEAEALVLRGDRITLHRVYAN